MNKIKDLFYDTSDIFAAMLILACAAIIIVTRVDSIITYPEKMFSDQPSQSGQIRPDIPDPPGPAEDGEGETGEGSAAEDGAGESGEEPQGDGEVSGGEVVGADSNGEVTSHSLYIAYGESMDSVAGDLVQLGLFENRQAFTVALERNNAGSKVQAGTFVIPSNATEDEVVKIITGRPN